jgi:endogenous inhibitor of DNA gyrase (YacG/DUF329 family)
MKGPVCPTCRKPLPADADRRFRPFCSERCKLIDLQKWLGGAFVIPGKPIVDPDEG